MRELATLIAARARPKSWGGGQAPGATPTAGSACEGGGGCAAATPVTGPVLAALLEAYVGAINSGAVPVIADAWEVRRTTAREIGLVGDMKGVRKGWGMGYGREKRRGVKGPGSGGRGGAPDGEKGSPAHAFQAPGRLRFSKGVTTVYMVSSPSLVRDHIRGAPLPSCALMS